MVERLKSHLGKHIVGYVALFIALGGTAVALPGKKLIDKNDLRKSVVKTKNIKNHAVTKSKLANNAVTPTSVSGLVIGNGQLLSRSASSGQVGFLPTPAVLADIPGFGQIQFLYCGTAPARQMRVRILSDDNAAAFFYSDEVRWGGVPPGTGQQQGSDTGGGSLSSGGGEPLLTSFTANGFTLGLSAKWDFQLWRGEGANTTGAHVKVSGVNSFDNQCHVNAQTIIQK